ncbi:MAG: PIN domain-containing protein [Chloroflexi bacterium]|nr:PIN domain-containing protein [Chloroflexota bacterium]
MERVPRSINERRVFVDSSAFLAYLDRNDRYYPEAGTVVEALLKARYHLVTTMYVVVETHSSILRAINPMAGRQFLVDGLKGISLLPTNSEDEENAKTLILQRRDKGYSFCDAISFSVMERFGLYLAFAYDDHFRQHGFSTPINQPEWP